MVNVTEGAALGAALLGGVGAGVYRDVHEAVDVAVRVTSRTQPDPAVVALYEREYPLYRNLYPALKPTFDALGLNARRPPRRCVTAICEGDGRAIYPLFAPALPVLDTMAECMLFVLCVVLFLSPTIALRH